jgi:hypothetical protein
LIPPPLLVIVECKFFQAWPGVPIFPSQPRGVVAERVVVDSVTSGLLSLGSATCPSLTRDVVEQWLYPIGIRAEPAFVGEMIRGHWDSHSSRDVVEHQQLAEGCWEVAARVVPPHKNPTDRPPIGYFCEAVAGGGMPRGVGDHSGLPCGVMWPSVSVL